MERLPQGTALATYRTFGYEATKMKRPPQGGGLLPPQPFHQTPPTAKRINFSVGYGIYDVPHVWSRYHSNAKQIPASVGMTGVSVIEDARQETNASTTRTIDDRPYGDVFSPQPTQFVIQRPTAVRQTRVFMRRTLQNAHILDEHPFYPTPFHGTS